VSIVIQLSAKGRAQAIDLSPKQDFVFDRIRIGTGSGSD